MTKAVILKAGKEKALKQRHHWIFSGAIETMPSFQNGEILPVNSAKGEHLGFAYFNKDTSIIGRMISFDGTPPLETIKKNILRAINLRERLHIPSSTNAYRLINGEGDNLPGLVVDRYNDLLVMQISTLGMDRLRSYIIDTLKERLKPLAIYEKSMTPSRKEEGLQPVQQWVYGTPQDPITFQENGLHFEVSVPTGQKTGFFLDQREMRQWVRQLSHSKRVLNAFSYTGGFSAYAAAGGAVQVDSVDISDSAIALARRNAELNQQKDVHRFFVDDVFTFLRERDLAYDLVILDPPAFAKRKKDVVMACRGYKDINRLAMQKMPAGSLLLTCSCSYYVEEDLFQKVLFQAALEAKRQVRIVGKHRMTPDHAINIFHPESDYLKSFLLFLD